MIHLGLPSAPLNDPCVYFECTRADYYRHLQDVREQSAWSEWIAYYARGIAEQCQGTMGFTRIMLALRERLHEEVGNVQRHASLRAVLDAFFQEPVLSIQRISEQANMAPNAVQAALDELQQLGIVYESREGRRGASMPSVGTQRRLRPQSIKTNAYKSVLSSKIVSPLNYGASPGTMFKQPLC